MRHALRLIGAGLLSGVIAGAIAGGLGSRLAMFVIRLMNSSFNGQITHPNAEVGVITLDGTMALVVEGMFTGVPGGLLYLMVRRWVPGRGATKGLAFGFILLVLAGGAQMTGNYEYVRYVQPAVSVTLFAVLFPLYGLIVSPLTEWLGAGTTSPPPNRLVRRAGYVVLGALMVQGLGQDLGVLQEFHIIG